VGEAFGFVAPAETIRRIPCFIVESQDVSVGICSTRGVPAGSNNDASASCVRRVALERRPLARVCEDVEGAPELWFVKVTVGGPRLSSKRVEHALGQLSIERAFLASARFDAERAEIRYWDECGDAEVAIRQALSLWGDDEVFARLPGWRVIGLEVVDRQTVRRQWDRGDHPRVFALGEIVPFD
jgi:hypothetical protein